MSGFGSTGFVWGNEEQLRVVTRWTSGNGAANASKVTGCTKGCASLAYNAATGKFLLTLTDWPGDLLDVKAINHRAASSAPLIGSPVWASIDKAAKTIPIEFWDLATPSLTNPANATNIVIELVFKRPPAA